MLKKIVTAIIVVTVGLCISANAYSQLGIKGGVNLSKFVGSDVSGAEDVMGLNAGISLRIISIGPVSLVPEIYYAQKGARFSDQIREFQNMDPDNPPDIDNFDLEFSLAYIEAPILLKLNLPFISTDVVKPFIGGGPVYAWRIDCDFSFVSSEGTDRAVRECADQNFPDVETAFKDADRGYVINTGVDFHLPLLGILTLDARYVRGLTRVRDTPENNDIQNQSISLMLGYTLTF